MVNIMLNRMKNYLTLHSVTCQTLFIL